jgi:HAE1 family hydrophobic/amphiphilic exporter-1
MRFLRCFLFISLIYSLFIFFHHQRASAQQLKPTPQIAQNKTEIKPKVESNFPNKKTETRATTENSDYDLNATRVGVQIQTVPMTLNEVIKKALENNNDIEVAKNDVKIAESNLRSLLGIYDLTFNISPGISRSSQTGAADSNLTNASATTTFQNEFSLNRPIKKGGGNYSAFFTTRKTDGILRFFFQTDPVTGQIITIPISTSQSFSTLGFNFTQPLFRNRKIDQNRRLIKIQRKRISQSDADFRRQAISVIAQVQQAYWDLVFALRDQQNRQANLNLTKENLRQVEAKIQAGTAAPLQKAEVETELANREADLLVAIQQVSVAENRLKQLIFKDPNSPEWSVQIVPTDTPVFSIEPIDLNAALQDAIEFRPELSRLKLEKEVNAIEISYLKNQVKPQIDLNTTFSLQGLANSQNSPIIPDYLTGGVSQSLQNLFRPDAPNFTVGLTISFPLRNQKAKADLVSAQLQSERLNAQMRSQELTVISEVRNAVQAVETARQRVLAARRARENAEIQLEGERQLLEVGRSTTFLLFQRENALTNARNAEIRAETDYNKALAELQRVTSTTFRANNIVVDSPINDQKDK